MKLFIHLLLVGVLALAPFGCKRDDGNTDQSVSANSQAERVAEPKPGAVREGAAPTARPQEYTQQKKVQPRAEQSPASERRQEARSVEPVRDVEREPAPAQSVNVPAGTEITVSLLDAVGTEISQEGDRFTASLSQPLMVNGKVVAEKGSRVSGSVQNIQEPGKVKGRARLELVLTSLTAAGRNYRLETEPFEAVGEDSKERDAATIAGGAAVGAVIGAATGGKKGAAIGAAIGGGTGTTAVLMTKGKQLRLDPETRVNFILSDDVSLPVIRRIIS